MSMGSGLNVPHIRCQMFLPVDLRWTGWASFAFSLSPLGALEQRSIETDGALLVDHTPTIKSVRAY